VIRTPSGRFFQPLADKPVVPVIMRVYTAPPWVEIARATLEV
jgi:hypothetical protein